MIPVSSNAEDWTYSPEVRQTLPAGIYWFGDLCYVLNDAVYDAAFGAYAYRDGYYTQTNTNHRFLVHGTAYGDGNYDDDHGNSYSVDAGILSLASLSVIDGGVEQVPRPGESIPWNMGVLRHFTEEVDCDFRGSIFTVRSGNLSFTVNTWNDEDAASSDDDDDEE
jgi:hypothetical protein